MKYLRLAGASLNQTPLAFGQNLSNILRSIEMAREQSVNVLCLPELALSGYGCEDAFFNDYVLEKCLEGLKTIVEASKDMTISVGLPLNYAHVTYNTVALIHDEQLLGFVAKQDLAGDGIYYEPRWFKPWPDNEVGALSLWGESFPVGDILIEVGGVRMGVEICEDAWNGIRPAQDHYIHNVDIILNPSASNFAFGKSLIRERLVTE
ncbi:MAG: nitrilase-related carbon-nitrogen hydrolase, partial [Bacteroidota bacterium]